MGSRICQPGTRLRKTGYLGKHGNSSRDVVLADDLHDIVGPHWCPTPIVGPYYFLNTSVRDFRNGDVEDEVLEMSGGIIRDGALTTIGHGSHLRAAPAMFPSLSGTE